MAKPLPTKSMQKGFTMRLEHEIAWAAGLHEGEGSICMMGFGAQRPHIRVSLGMTDEEPVRRFAKIVGARVSGPHQHGRKKPIWRANMNRQSQVVRFLWMVKDYLGPRRREQIKSVIFATQRARREWDAAHPKPTCSGCGCHRDEQTRGCSNCRTRHCQRRRRSAEVS